MALHGLKAKEAATFRLLDKNWSAEISAMAVNTKSERCFNKQPNLPHPSDHKKLSAHNIKEAELSKKSTLHVPASNETQRI